MSQENTVPMTEDEILEYTRSVRMRAVNQLTAEGVPTGNQEAMDVIFKSLDGLDRSAIATKRIKVDEKQGANNAALLQSVVAAVLTSDRKTNFRVENPVTNHSAPALPETLEDISLVPGETDVGLSQDTIEEFKTRMQDTF